MTKEMKTLQARSEIPVENTWDLSKIFTSRAAFDESYAWVESKLPEFEQFKGQLGSAETLLRLSQLRDEVELVLSKICVFAVQSLSVDMTDTNAVGLYGQAENLRSRLGQSLSFVEPELIALGEEKLQALKENDLLAIYRRSLEELQRQAKHVRSAEVEQVLAELQPVFSSFSNTFNTFTGTLQFPPATDANGETHVVSTGTYNRLLQSEDRELRRSAFESLFGTLSNHQDALAAMYYAQVQADVTNARLRGYESSLQMRLSELNMPVQCYKDLIAFIRSNASALQRFQSLRKRLLGLDKLHPYDLNAPLARRCGMFEDLTFDKAAGAVVDSVAIMGNEYQSVVKRGFDERWVDWRSSKGKQGGAYSYGTYGTPPYVFMNFNGTLSEAITLAHEFGHSMHSYHSRRSQPFATHAYSLLTAETASTVNEILLFESLRTKCQTVEEKQHLLAGFLSCVFGTIHRQTMFAEYEMRAHELVEKGEVLSAPVLKGIYADILRAYYGDQLELGDDSAYLIDVLRVPHFFRSFYVHQYVWGAIARSVIFSNFQSEGQPAIDRHLRFLSAGNSKDSLDLFKDNLADPTDRASQEKAFTMLNAWVDELESLFAQ